MHEKFAIILANLAETKVRVSPAVNEIIISSWTQCISLLPTRSMPKSFLLIF